MKKTLTILTTIVLMAFAFCGCGAPKEVLSHPERTTASEPAFSTTAVETTVETIEPETIEKTSEEVDNPIWPTTHWLADLIPHTDYITEVNVLVDKSRNHHLLLTQLHQRLNSRRIVADIGNFSVFKPDGAFLNSLFFYIHIAIYKTFHFSLPQSSIKVQGQYNTFCSFWQVEFPYSKGAGRFIVRLPFAGHLKVKKLQRTRT